MPDIDPESLVALDALEGTGKRGSGVYHEWIAKEKYCERESRLRIITAAYAPRIEAYDEFVHRVRLALKALDDLEKKHSTAPPA